MKLLAFSFAILLFNACGYAQPDRCASTTIGLTGSAGYPPIALAAHVSGKVDFRIRFTAAGEIERVQAISGPPMLIPAAKKLVAGFTANANGAIRVCAMTVNYVIHNGEWDNNCQAIQNPVSPLVREDMHHWTVQGTSMPTCDPSATITQIKHRILFIHWYTKVIGS